MHSRTFSCCIYKSISFLSPIYGWHKTEAKLMSICVITSVYYHPDLAVCKNRLDLVVFQSWSKNWPVWREASPIFTPLPAIFFSPAPARCLWPEHLSVQPTPLAVHTSHSPVARNIFLRRQLSTELLLSLAITPDPISTTCVSPFIVVSGYITEQESFCMS